MKRLLFVCIFIASLLCLTAFAADDAVVKNATYIVEGGSDFEISFSVETEKENSWAVISSHDDDGRLVSVKLVPVTDEPVSQKLGNINEISYAKIVIVEATSTLKPLCAHTVVDNYSKNGDTDISVTPLFPEL